MNHTIGVFLINWVISFFALGAIFINKKSSDGEVVVVLIITTILATGIALLSS